MKNTILVLLLSVLFGSCSTQNKFRKSEFKGITNELNTSIENKSLNGPDFLSLFNIDQQVSNISISFDHEGDFKITYYSNYLERNGFRTFSGKFKKNYYEIYLQRKNIVFPPIYWVRNVERIRISIANDSTLVVDRYSDHGGMILLFAAGSSSRVQYSYKQIKNTKS